MRQNSVSDRRDADARSGFRKDRSRSDFHEVNGCPDSRNAGARSGFRRVRALWGSDTWVRPFLARYRKTLALSLALGVLTMAFAAALMFTSGYLISISADRPEMGVYAISAVLGFVQIFGIGKPFLGYFERLTSHDWVLRLTSALRAKLYGAMEAESIFRTAARKTGEALGLLAEDIGHLQNMYLRVVFPQIVAALIALLLTVLLGVFSPLLGLAVLLLMAVLVALVPLVSVMVNGKRRLAAKTSRSRHYDVAFDNMEGLADWNFSGRRDDFIKSMTYAYDEAKEHETKADAFDRTRDVAVQAVFCLLVVTVFAWAGSYFGGMVQSGAALGDITRPVNWVAAFVLGLFPLAEAFAPLSNGAVEMACHLDAVERLNSIAADARDGEHGEYGEEPAAAGSTAAAGRDEHGETPAAAGSPAECAGHDLKLDHVCFSYPGSGAFGAGDDTASGADGASAAAATDADAASGASSADAVIRDVSLFIPAGQKLAILGPSGTGKSTLAWLLRGDLTPTAGSVTLGGVPTCRLTDPSKHFGFIQQSPYLFNKTLLENLRLANPDATEQQALDALEAVDLGNLVRSLPEGMNTMVDEAGLRFSGGERHRIALARILLADTPLVILDEPTVSLDPATEQQLLQTVLKVLEGRTIIMITHHLAGVSPMDRVVFLENGRIAMEGSPAQLAAESERYRRLEALSK